MGFFRGLDTDPVASSYFYNMFGSESGYYMRVGSGMTQLGSTATKIIWIDFHYSSIIVSSISARHNGENRGPFQVVLYCHNYYFTNGENRTPFQVVLHYHNYYFTNGENRAPFQVVLSTTTTTLQTERIEHPSRWGYTTTTTTLQTERTEHPSR